MADIRFFIPEDEVIPTDLRLYVDGIYVTYKHFDSGFRFFIYLDDEEKAMEVAKEIVQQMKIDHDESQHGVSWRTISLEIVPQEGWYKTSTIIDWKYRVRDSY